MQMLLVVLLVVTFFIPAAPGQQNAGEKVIARAGSALISEEEFLQRFELLPALYRHRKPQLQGAKVELLYSMVAEKLLAQEALRRNLDSDTIFASSFLSIRKMLARDQLYRNEIRNRVTATPGEIVRELNNAQTLVHVVFLYFDRREDAEFVRGLIRTAVEFDRTEPDSTMLALRDTATVIWGDAEYAIEEGAYALRPGDVSPVIRARTGYYVLRCLEIKPNTALSELSADVLKDRVTKRIRQRKEDAMMHEFIRSALKDATGYARPEPFKVLARALVSTLERAFMVGKDSVLALSKEMSEAIRAQCATMLHDSFVVAGTMVWTIDDVVERLFMKNFAVAHDRVNSIPPMLNDELEYWVQQELLSQEALRRGLDEHPEVRHKARMWKDAYLADMMKLYARRHVTVSDTEVWTYMKLMDTTAAVPRVQLRELRTSTLDAMQDALADLEGGMDFPEVVKKWTIELEAGINAGVTRLLAVTEYPQVGEIAAEMNVGERFGPMRVGDEVLFFEVLAKESLHTHHDTLVGWRFEEAAEEYRALKQQGVLNQFLARVAQDQGVDVYTDRLLRLEVTPVPMLTFRYLGFGGRMFEVPFVDPQLQWLYTNPPEGQVLP